MELTDDERRTLVAEADLLDRVATLASAPGRVRHDELDHVLRAVDVPPAHGCGPCGHRVPAPRSRPAA